MLSFVVQCKSQNDLLGMKCDCALLQNLETKSIFSRSTARQREVCGLLVGVAKYKVLSIVGPTITALVTSLSLTSRCTIANDKIA